MDVLDHSLSSLSETARQIALFLEEDGMQEIQQNPLTLSKGNQNEPVAASPYDSFQEEFGEISDIPSENRSDQTASFESPILKEDSIQNRQRALTLYPPIADSYRTVSQQMLEDMRRRSTLPLDDVRTVIL